MNSFQNEKDSDNEKIDEKSQERKNWGVTRISNTTFSDPQIHWWWKIEIHYNFSEACFKTTLFSWRFKRFAALPRRIPIDYGLSMVNSIQTLRQSTRSLFSDYVTPVYRIFSGVINAKPYIGTYVMSYCSTPIHARSHSGPLNYAQSFEIQLA